MRNTRTNLTEQYGFVDASGVTWFYRPHRKHPVAYMYETGHIFNAKTAPAFSHPISVQALAQLLGIKS